MPAHLPAVRYPEAAQPIQIVTAPTAPEAKAMDGVDVFVHAPGVSPDELAGRLREAAAGHWLALRLITNRGVKVWPGGMPETFCTDHWRCRFLAPAEGAAARSQVTELLGRLDRAGVDWVKTEGLYRFGGEPGYSLGQGQ